MKNRVIYLCINTYSHLFSSSVVSITSFGIRRIIIMDKHQIHHKVLKDNNNNNNNNNATTTTTTNKNDVDINDMILKSGCSVEYYQLEECLCDNNRKWLNCQVIIIIFINI